MANLRILVNSMPKSGTHLLSKVVGLLGYENISFSRGLLRKALDRFGFSSPKALEYERVNRNWERRIYKWFGLKRNYATVPIGVMLPLQVPSQLLVRWLNNVPRGYYIIGHLPWSQTSDEIIKQLRFKHILIIRDPRDVLVSYIHFVQRPGGPMRDDFLNLSKEKQLRFVMTGGYAPIIGRQFTGLENAFRSVIGWKKSSNLLMVHFEDLVGAKGGGSYDAQLRTIKEISRSLEINPDDKFITDVCERAFDNNSPTFRRGQIGSRRSVLTPEQLAIFNESGGWLLDELHYDRE